MAPSPWTVLSRVSSSCVWFGSVVTTNGMVAVAPGWIEPVNVTVNPVTVQPSGGPGSVSMVVVVCAVPGQPGPV